MEINTPSETDEKRDHVVEQAKGVFLRYGFRRSTMGDLAKAAGMSRPALYLVFPNKEEVFAAVIEAHTKVQFAAISAAIENVASLEERLTIAMRLWSEEGFEIVRTFPDARDLIDLRHAPVQAAYSGFEALLADVLRDPIAHSRLETTPEAAARMLTYATRGFKDAVGTFDELFDLIRLNIQLLVRALEASD